MELKQLTDDKKGKVPGMSQLDHSGLGGAPLLCLTSTTM